MATTEITWTTTDLSRARIDHILGADFVADFIARPGAKGAAQCRARGAWEANERETHATYRSLAKLLGDVA